MAKLYEEFDNNLQHDAQEFHEKLLDTLNDQSKSSRSMLRQVLISTTFQCQIMETKKCRLCQSEVMTSTDNYSVWLPVPSSDEEISLEQVLADYFELNPNLEKRCAENECGSETFSVETTLTNIPTVLTINLKRFTYDENSKAKANSAKVKKISTPIELATEIDLKKFLHPDTVLLGNDNNEQCKYTLQSVICHTGRTARSGHYTAYVRRGDSNGCWYHFDDEEVTQVNLHDVKKFTRNKCYIISYINKPAVKS